MKIKQTLFHKAGVAPGLTCLLACRNTPAGPRATVVAINFGGDWGTLRLRTVMERRLVFAFLTRWGFSARISGALRAHEATSGDYWQKAHLAAQPHHRVHARHSR